jgi:hypothetical protein
LSKYTEKEIDHFGRKLQMVDDMLDLEKDAASGDTNCFHLPAAQTYRTELRRFLRSEFFRELEQNSWVYKSVRMRCERKLQRGVL